MGITYWVGASASASAGASAGAGEGAGVARIPESGILPV